MCKHPLEFYSKAPDLYKNIAIILREHTTPSPKYRTSNREKQRGLTLKTSPLPLGSSLVTPPPDTAVVSLQLVV